MNVKIVIVEDDPDFAETMVEILQKLGYETLTILSGTKDIVSAILNYSPDLVLMDIVLGENKNGIDIAQEITSLHNIPVIYLTGYTEDYLIERAKTTEPMGYIVKPIKINEMKIAIELALYKSKTEAELKAYRNHLKELVEERTLELQRAEEKYKTLFDDSPICLMELDCSETIAYIREHLTKVTEDSKTYLRAHIEITREALAKLKIVDINKMALDLTGEKSREDLLLKMTHSLCEDIVQSIAGQLILATEGVSRSETETLSGNVEGKQRYIFYRWSVPPGFEQSFTRVLVSFMDITERKLYEESLKASLSKKELLLKEIHHRVKNNTQIMSSLISLQARSISDDHLREIFNSCRDRISAMALIHEKIYSGKDLEHIEFSEYLRYFVGYLIRSYGRPGVTLSLKGEKNIYLDLDYAIPCSLILNELISNAFKHAFQGREKGEIIVELDADDEKGITLIVCDNGIGFPENLKPEDSPSLGMQLVSSLVRQIRATIELSRENGTSVAVTFIPRGH